MSFEKKSFKHNILCTNTQAQSRHSLAMNSRWSGALHVIALTSKWSLWLIFYWYIVVMENNFNLFFWDTLYFDFVKDEGAAQNTVSNGDVAAEPALVRTGKWKIPSSKDYLDLFKGLLDCENMKVWTFVITHQICIFPTFFSRKSHLNTVNLWTAAVIIKPVLIQELFFTLF